MALIKLTRGLFAQIYDADYEWLSRWKWHAVWAEVGFYAARVERRPGGKRVTIYMHRVILCPPSDRVTDHIDRDGLNNHRCNLRVATRFQNARNARRRSDCKSQFKGVRNESANCNLTRPWRAVIGGISSGTRRHLGYFATEEDAARAYDVAAREAYGEFAFQNFPESDS